MSRALGRYELLRPLARGGMAEVYLARRRAAGVEKWLVVKRIRPERSNDVRFLDLFVREARLSMSLAHQNIGPVFDFGRIDDQVFLAMERIEGKDLGSSLARAGANRLPPLVGAFIAAECCQALDYAHHRKSPDGTALGIVHRDVTPRNVLLSWSGEVKLTDFGIAALAGDATSKLLGTPAYMAPEQARGEPLDARADVYAIGMVLRETITGERARAGTDRDALVEAAKTGVLVPWPAPGAGREPIPDALVAIVDRATAPTPDDRFPDARSMLEELDAFMVGERAARKSEAPARVLATWLKDLWAGDRDDLGLAGEVTAHPEHMVSFLDDGALDVVGTGTMRSIAATAADEAEVPAVAPPVLPPSPVGAATVTTGGPAASAPAAKPDLGATVTTGLPEPAPATSPTQAAGGELAAHAETPGPPRQLRAERAPASPGRWIAVGVVALVAAGAAFVRLRGGGHDAAERGSAVAERGTTPGSDGSAGSTVARAPDPGGSAVSGSGRSGSDTPVASGSDTPAASGSDTPVASGSDTPAASGSDTPGRSGSETGTSADSGSATEPRASGDGRGSDTNKPGRSAGRPTPGHKPGEPTGGSATAGTARTGSGAATGTDGGGTAASEASTLRSVTISATPWAYFSVDGSGEYETPKTLMLAPGKHRVHFKNPVLNIERTVEIDVPADRNPPPYVERLGN